jgi:predicted dehydrogenase
MACGAQAHLRFSAITGLAPGGEVWLYGSEGTVRVDMAGTKIYGGRRGDSELKEIPIADEKRGAWRVEEEFINAIRGIEQITHTPFNVGVHYMEWTEAVTRSAQTGEAVSLPL